MIFVEEGVNGDLNFDKMDLKFAGLHISPTITTIPSIINL
jgi:hypothetical protein